MLRFNTYKVGDRKREEIKLKTKNKNIFLWLSVLAATFFNLLYWKQSEGISFPITVFLVISIGFILAKIEGVKAAKSSYWLILPIAFFSIFNLFRLEPMTQFLNHAIVLVLMILLVNTLRGGLWWKYGFADYIGSFFKVCVSSVFNTFPFLQKKNDVEKVSEEKSIARRILSGLLIALPLLLFFSNLFSQADAVFSSKFDNILEFIDRFNLAEFIYRLFFISFISLILLGVYLHSISKNHDEKLSSDKEKKGLIGFIEIAVVQISIILLFSSFVFIQFKYFFGSQANISFTGFTYAQYARRGFNELVTSTIITVALVMFISFYTKVKNKKQRIIISSLSTFLISLDFVLLYSAFQRLRLYENAYGFSRFRTYTHVFIICLSVFLLAIVLLEWFKKRRYYAFSILVLSMVFIASLNIINVDRLIVSKNIDHYEISGQVDNLYIISLSLDALPPLIKAYEDKPDQTIAEAIFCNAINARMQINLFDTSENTNSLPSLHFSKLIANKNWEQWLLNQPLELQNEFNREYLKRFDAPSWEDYEYQCFELIYD